MEKWRKTLSMYGRTLTNDFKEPCEKMFEILEKNSQQDLLALVREGSLKNSELTFAVECLGKAKLDAGLPVLGFMVLNHESIIVREGALYGLKHYQTQTARTFMELCAIWETDHLIKTTAIELLKNEFI